MSCVINHSIDRFVNLKNLRNLSLNMHIQSDPNTHFKELMNSSMQFLSIWLKLRTHTNASDFAYRLSNSPHL